MNRYPRTSLPSVKLPKPSRIEKSKRLYKHHYDKGVKNLPPLDKGQSARIHNKSDWSRKGIVIDKSPQPRSYLLATDKGTIITRNQRDLLRRAEHVNFHSDYDLSDNICDQNIPVSHAPSDQPAPPVPPVNVPARPPVVVPPCVSPVSTQPYKTRSGRIVYKPAKYKDYHSSS